MIKYSVWQIGSYDYDTNRYRERCISRGLTQEQAESEVWINNMGSDCYTYTLRPDLPDTTEQALKHWHTTESVFQPVTTST